jgi:hypothetical protein
MKMNEFRSVVKDSGNFNVCNRITEISVSDYLNEDYHKPRKPFSRNMVFSALSLMIILTMGFFIRLSVNPVTTLTIDINPSIEVELNVFNRVINIAGTNQDGLEFIDELSYKNKPIEDVIQNIYNTGVEMEYFTESEAYMLVGVYGEDYDTEVHLGEILAEITEINILSIFQHNSINPELSLTVSMQRDAVESTSDYLTGVDETPALDNQLDDNYYSDDFDMTTLLEQYQISEAKMVLVVNIFNASETYIADSDFEYLVDLDIATLIEMYGELE